MPPPSRGMHETSKLEKLKQFCPGRLQRTVMVSESLLAAPLTISKDGKNSVRQCSKSNEMYYLYMCQPTCMSTYKQTCTRTCTCMYGLVHMYYLFSQIYSHYCYDRHTIDSNSCVHHRQLCICTCTCTDTQMCYYNIIVYDRYCRLKHAVCTLDHGESPCMLKFCSKS